MRSLIKHYVKKLPGIRGLVRQRDELVQEREALRNEAIRAQAEADAFKKSHGFVPPGHFYSPIPDFEQVRCDAPRIFGQAPRRLPGIELNEQAQLDLLKQFIPYYRELPFRAEAQPGLRYYFDNPAYSWSDAILLHCMIRHLHPKRIIEVGSGYSSCMMLDTRELFFDAQIDTTFIEPYPELLLSLLKPGDREAITVIPTRLQDVDPGVFEALQARDILFIDSTHVSRIDSDVNYLLFTILPRLAPGVRVHFHDIFYPFEYPEEWVNEGRAWNEAYILKAFLQYNSRFHVELMNTYMELYHEDFFRKNLPLCLNNTGGSIWLCKE